MDEEFVEKLDERRAFVTRLMNDPLVLDAYATLIAAGFIIPPDRAEVFCAYCGVHIIYTLPERNRANGYDPIVEAAVTKHRAGCEKYQAQR